MKETPIVLTALEASLIDRGLKTQLRRTIEPAPICVNGVDWPQEATELSKVTRSPFDLKDMVCPYGAPGDLLWVQEPWRLSHGITGPQEEQERERFYLADYAEDPGRLKYYEKDKGPWRKARTMPRWAARLLLRVEAIRAERLSTISEIDARAEGITELAARATPIGNLKAYALAPYRYAFLNQWEFMYGADAIDSDPMVWVLSFIKNG